MLVERILPTAPNCFAASRGAFVLSPAADDAGADAALLAMVVPGMPGMPGKFQNTPAQEHHGRFVNNLPRR